MDILIKGIKKIPEDGGYIHLIIQNGKVHTAISCGYLTTDKLNVGMAIELLHCKDCDSFIEETNTCTSFGSWTQADGYCHKAERRK